jgi:hypothetical protein
MWFFTVIFCLSLLGGIGVMIGFFVHKKDRLKGAFIGGLITPILVIPTCIILALLSELLIKAYIH